ncbi:MAG TPA: BBE domain-containing protein, partial [Gaiellaceae bacterium]|nr:BBE domain-containing protein [Gaiellaceae bacterium]
QSLFDAEYPDGQRHYWKSAYLSDVDAAVADLCDRGAASRPSPLSSIGLWALGGALRNEPEGGSAFAQRDAPFLFGLEANWEEADGDADNLAWARDLFDGAKAHSPGGSYLNFPGFAEEGEELLKDSYGASYERLKELKAKYDPENVFRSSFSIPVG